MSAGPPPSSFATAMRAAVYHGRGDVRVQDVPVPAISEDEILLEVTAVGICGTDAHEYAHGPTMFPIDAPHPVTGHSGPMIPGHEFAGRVAALGAGVDGLGVGDRVATGAGISCGECFPCRRGRSNLCRRYATLGLQRNGGLARFCAVPAATCVAAPDGLSDDAVGLAQPMSIAVHTTRRGRLEVGEEVVVIGVGGIGAFITYTAAQLGARVLAIDVDETRLTIAAALGAVHVARAGEIDLAAQVRDLGLQPTLIFETSATPAGLNAALAVIEFGGRIVLVGFQRGTPPVAFRDISLREIELIGTNAHVLGADMPEALRLLAARPDPWSDVAPRVLSLERLVPDGLAPLAEGRAASIKTLIDPRAEVSRPSRM